MMTLCFWRKRRPRAFLLEMLNFSLRLSTIREGFLDWRLSYCNVSKVIDDSFTLGLMQKSAVSSFALIRSLNFKEIRSSPLQILPDFLSISVKCFSLGSLAIIVSSISKIEDSSLLSLMLSLPLRKRLRITVSLFLLSSNIDSLFLLLPFLSFFLLMIFSTFALLLAQSLLKIICKFQPNGSCCSNLLNTSCSYRKDQPSTSQTYSLAKKGASLAQTASI